MESQPQNPEFRMNPENFQPYHLCNRLGPRPRPIFCQARSRSKPFDNLMVFLKEFFEKVDFEKNQQTAKKHYPLSKELNINTYYRCYAVKLNTLLSEPPILSIQL